MTAAITVTRPTDLVSPEQAAAVKEYLNSLSTQPGYRQGETSTPTANLLTFEVSSWLQIPQIIKALETHGDEGIRLVFPTHSDPTLSAKAAELREFFEHFHSKPCSELIQELAGNIDTSGELNQANAAIDSAYSIDSGAQWVAAFQLDKLLVKDNLKVTNVVDVTTSSAGTVDPSIFVHADTSVAAGREVIYQIDGTQGAASALFEQLKSLDPDAINPLSYSIWSGSTVYYPKAENPTPVRDIKVTDFVEQEERKAPLLEEIHRFTSPHSNGFELAKIRTWELEQEDRNGVSVLDNLTRILEAQELKGVTKHLPANPALGTDVEEWRAHLLAAAVERLYHPGKANQDRHGTCGAESIIRLVGKVSVGEWARVVADLIVDGESAISPTITLKPSDDWTVSDISESRVAFDALLQSAVMRRAAEKLGFNYHNTDDSFRDNAGEIQYEVDSLGNSVYELDEDGNAILETDGSKRKQKLNGMPQDCACELISAWLSEYYESIEATSLKSEFGDDYAGRLAELASKIGGIYVSLEWGHESHAVVLTGYDSTNNRFIFSNPHGEDPARSSGDLIAKSSGEPERFIVDNEFGIQAMTRETFERLLQAAILPRA